MSTQSPRIASILYEVDPETKVDVSGWVRSRRDSKGGFSFINLNDGSCMSNLQIVVDADVPGYEETIKQVTTGSAIRVTGTVKETPKGKQRVEMHADSLTLLGTADGETYPLQKKRHSFEFLREIAHLRPRTNTFGAVARVRNCICTAIHDFFQERGFLSVQTPIITTSDCEGAGEMFTVTTLDSKTAHANHDDDFFGKKASLTVSGQLEAEIYATALGPVYTFGPTFRAENSHTKRHLAEFWMVEPEMPFFELNDNMQLAQEFIQFVVQRCLDRCMEDMEFFNERIDKTVLETCHNILKNDFKQVSYTEAVELVINSGQDWEYPVEWGSNLQAEHERWLTEEHFQQPIIVFNYPRTIKPFYMYCNEGEEPGRETVRAMDVLVPRVGEIIGGSQREHRLDVLQSRLKECDLPEEEYWWYMDLRRFGTVPHAGFGLGLERMVLLLTGMENIRDVIPFPRTPNHAEF